MQLSPYQRRLLVFLSVATFFEGYDIYALAQILPNIRRDFALTEAHGGRLITVISVGSVLAYFLIRKADQWGRKRVLSITIAGYTLASLATAAAPNVYVFAACQLAARMFLVSEWAIAMVFAAEEYPAARRGMVIGVIQACAVLGGVTCAIVVPFLLKTPLGWRAVFMVGSVPLIVVAFARRNVRETERFTKTGSAITGSVVESFVRVFRSAYRGRVIQLAIIWCLMLVGTQNAVLFWKEFATAERGLSDVQVGLSLGIAALAALPFLFLVGPMLDRIGRRLGAIVIYSAATLGIIGAYTLWSRAGLVASLVIGIVGTNAAFPVLNAFTTELFPTHLRGDAFAVSNNLMGRLGYLGSPTAIGILAADWGWGKVVASTSIFAVAALILILVLLPETRGKELEETSLVEPQSSPSPSAEPH